MKRVAHMIGLTTRFTTLVGGLAIALMMVHVTVDVAARYILNAPPPGTITIVSHYYMVVAVFLPLALAEQRDTHISVEVFASQLPWRVQTGLAVFNLLVTLAVLVVFTLRTWQEAVRQMASNAAVLQGNSTLIIWPSHFLLPVGLGLMAVVVIYKLVDFVTNGGAPLNPGGSADSPVAMPE